MIDTVNQIYVYQILSVCCLYQICLKSDLICTLLCPSLIPTSRSVRQLLVLKKSLNEPFHFLPALIWVPKHPNRIQAHHLPDRPVFQWALVLHFLDYVAKSLNTLPLEFLDPELCPSDSLEKKIVMKKYQ